MKYFKPLVPLTIMIMLTCFCSKNKEEVIYKPLTFEKLQTRFVTQEVFKVGSIIKHQNKVFFISFPNAWVADLDKKEVKLLFTKGMGPNEIYWPNRLVRYDDSIFINSYWPLKHIYHFSPDSTELVLQNLEIPAATTFNDYFFLSPDQLVMANVDWEEGDLVRIYDLTSGQHQSMGERTFTPIMKKFNVNIASMCILQDRIYVVQTIVPEIQVISIQEHKVIDKITLSPPFYKPMPAEYNVKKLDRKAHMAWTELWTSLYDISGKDQWLLVTYQTWVEEAKQYSYELINLKDQNNRFIIDQTPYLVYDFEISGGLMHMEMCEEKGESVRWLMADIRLH